MTVYGIKGPRAALSYHKKCATCSSKYYSGYIQTQDCKKQFQPEALDQCNFFTSNRTAFETHYLKTITDLIEVAGVSFRSLSDSYNCTHDCELEPQRLEEAYFLRRLLLRFTQTNMPMILEQRDDSCRLDIEEVCRQCLDAQPDTLRQFDKHQCTTPGCSEGFLMADGIEKVRIHTEQYSNY